MTEKYNYCDFEMMAACRAVEAQPEQEPTGWVLRSESAAVKRLELIAEDYTFTFRTVEQRWAYNKPYGP